MMLSHLLLINSTYCTAQIASCLAMMCAAVSIKCNRLHFGMFNRIIEDDGLPDGSGKPVKRRRKEEPGRQGTRYKRTTAAADLQRTAGTGADV